MYEAIHGKVSDNASNMVKGWPASSAGVERMFSKAGKLHGDEKKAQEDSSLEHALFAAANTE